MPGAKKELPFTRKITPFFESSLSSMNSGLSSCKFPLWLKIVGAYLEALLS
jgi:hypothetical protein